MKKQGVTSELNMQLSFEESRNRSKEIVALMAEEQQICYLHTAPCGTGVAQKTAKF